MHRARTLDGEDVVIKVQHKGMEARMYGDMNTMLSFSLMMERLGLNVNFDHVRRPPHAEGLGSALQ